MIDSTTLTYKFFHDSRGDGDPEFEGGDSGTLYLATDQSGKKYIIKHTFMMDAANEFIGSWLARQIGILAPKVQLLTPHKKFKSKFAVAIEYLDLSPLSAGQYDWFEMAPIFILGNLINSEDGIQAQGLNGHICNYDFAESFSINAMELFYKASKLEPSILTNYLANSLRSFTASLDFLDFDYTLYAEKYGLDPDEFNKRAVAAARKILDIPDEEFAVLYDELAEIYTTEIVRYYANCISAIKEKVSEI